MKLTIKNNQVYLDEIEVKGISELSIKPIGLKTFDKSDKAIVTVSLLVDLETNTNNT